MANKYGILFFETSAFTGENIQELFLQLADLVAVKKSQQSEQEPSEKLINNEGLERSKKKKCC